MRFGEEYAGGGGAIVHPGLDLNLLTGGDSDLGEPVYAAADGVVAASGWYPVWGNVVVIRHEGAGGLYWSQYAHLYETWVNRGERVSGGDLVGSIGKGAGNKYMAHLHFEVRRRDIPPDAWPGGSREIVNRDYVDPRTLFGRQT